MSTPGSWDTKCRLSAASTMRSLRGLLAADPKTGLTTEEARYRLARVGLNRVGEHPETSLWRLMLAQFRSLVVLLRLAAAVIAAPLGERIEALAILTALLRNAGIGFLTEWRARASLAKLRALAVPEALVRRCARVIRLSGADVVPIFRRSPCGVGLPSCESCRHAYHGSLRA